MWHHTQELVGLRQANAALQAQLAENTGKLTAATSKAQGLAGDNQKLHDALQALQSSQTDKAFEIAKQLKENSDLRTVTLRLEADVQAARDAAASSERKLHSTQEV
jgi:chromosome segregation ATPase